MEYEDGQGRPGYVKSTVQQFEQQHSNDLRHQVAPFTSPPGGHTVAPSCHQVTSPATLQGDSTARKNISSTIPKYHANPSASDENDNSKVCFRSKGLYFLRWKDFPCPSQS